jgi:phosphate transport system substrate-binding protein
MKRFLILLSVIVVLNSCSEGKKPIDSASSGRITVSGAWALYPMVVKWAEVYQKLYPETIIDISAGGAGKGMADALNQAVDLGMVSRDINKAEIEKGAWWVSVTRDAVIATINENNPFKDELLKRGLTKNEISRIWLTGDISTWSTLIAGKKTSPLHVYTRCDACGAAETWAKYVGGSQEDLKGIGVYGDPGLVDTVRNDVLGIGYNNVNFAYDLKTKKPHKGIVPLPLDINGNGRIEAGENFYNDRDSLTKAIADGIYPSPPARNLHLVSRGIPQKKQVLQFLIWILNEGQRYMADSGYIALPQKQIKKQSDELQKNMNDMK